MLAPVILAEIMQHAKLALHTEIISVCVLLDLDLKVRIVIEVRNPLNFFVVSKVNVWPFLILQRGTLAWRQKHLQPEHVKYAQTLI